jgi:hypothetical protein
MSESHMSPDANSSRWIVAATCSVLVILVTIGSVFAMRDRLLAQTRETTREQTAAREKLEARVDRLQSDLEALSTQAKPDAAALESIQSTLAEGDSKLAVLTARVDALEKKAQEKPPEPAPAPVVVPAAAEKSLPSAQVSILKLAALSGDPFPRELQDWLKLHPTTEKQVAPLTQVAANGIVSEDALSRKLIAILDEKPTPAPVDDMSMTGKINTHLKGLVSIKKTTAPDSYETLRTLAQQNDINGAERAIETLSESERAPFAAWLTLAQQRRAALDALSSLTSDTAN